MCNTWLDELVAKSFGFYLPYRESEVSLYVKERPLREIFKAIQDMPATTSKTVLRQMVRGRVYKTFERLLEKKESERKARIRTAGDDLLKTIGDFVDFFWDNVFLAICEGRIANVRRYQNQIADGYTFKLLQRLEEEWNKETSVGVNK
jgi:CRISPR type I-D-associated protein Csc3/Cas10d